MDAGKGGRTKRWAGCSDEGGGGQADGGGGVNGNVDSAGHGGEAGERKTG